MDENTDQGSCSDQGVLVSRLGTVHLLCEVRPSASDETLGLPTDIFQAVLAKSVQQRGTASSLRLSSRSLAHGCGAALVTGTFHLRPPHLHGPHGELQCWLWQVGILQRAFPNSTLRMDNVVRTADAASIHQLLNCTELRDVTICPTSKPVRRARQWQALAALDRLHGGRLQLRVSAHAFRMLAAEPALAAHVSQATLAWGAGAGSSLADQVSSLSSLTKLTLRNRDSPLGAAGMLDALRQLSALQSLHCLASAMRMLLVNSVPSSWPLLTTLQLRDFICEPQPLNWSLVEQQCPQLQELTMYEAVPLCLTALTSLTCHHWEPRDTDSLQCSRLGHLHVLWSLDLKVLPSTLTSLSLHHGGRHPLHHIPDQHLSSQQCLVHISFTSVLWDLSDIPGLIPAIQRPALSPSVTSVQLCIRPQALILPDMNGSMARQHFHHLVAWFPHLQRLHIHLPSGHVSGELLISAEWLPAHCRLVVTHNLTCPVRVVKYPSGCLSLPLASRPVDEWRSY